LGMAEDEPIEHRLISKALETAQEKIEGFNFDSRKHVLEFDDVINTQRSSVYGRRRKLLLGSVDEVEQELNNIIGSAEASPVADISSREPNRIPLVGLAGRNVRSGAASANNIPATASPDGTFPERALAARGDSAREGNVAAGETVAGHVRGVITKKISDFGRENFLNAVRIVLLQTIDMYWVEHLEVMDYTRSSVNLRAYGQRDPLVEYKKEGLRLFREMQAAMREQVIKILPHVTPMVNGQAANHPPAPSSNKEGESASEIILHGQNLVARPLPSSEGRAGEGSNKENKLLGRNDPCWCGSVKKYKKCHGK